MSAFQPKNNLDLLFGGMSGLAGAASGVRAEQERQADRAFHLQERERLAKERAEAAQPVDASAVAQKYARMMQSGRMSAKEAAFMAQQEMQLTQSALAPQSLSAPLPSAPLPGQQASTINGLRGTAAQPNLAQGLRGPSLSPGDLALQPPPVTFNRAETKALQDYDIPQNYRAREGAREQADRLRLQESWRSTRQEDTQEHQLALEDKKQGGRLELQKIRLKGTIDAINQRAAQAIKKFGGNPKRKEIVNRIGQKQKTLNTLYNAIIQTPEKMSFAEELKGDISELEAELQQLEDTVVTEERAGTPQRRQAPYTPREGNAPPLNTTTPVQEPQDWDTRINELERRKQELLRKAQPREGGGGTNRPRTNSAPPRGPGTFERTVPMTYSVGPPRVTGGTDERGRRTLPPLKTIKR